MTLDPVWLGRNGGLHRYLRRPKFFKLTAAVRRPPLIQGRTQVGLYILCSPSPCSKNLNGEVAERLKAHAWKACVGLYPTEGSNPSLSAPLTRRGNWLTVDGKRESLGATLSEGGDWLKVHGEP